MKAKKIDGNEGKFVFEIQYGFAIFCKNDLINYCKVKTY